MRRRRMSSRNIDYTVYVALSQQQTWSQISCFMKVFQRKFFTFFWNDKFALVKKVSSLNTVHINTSHEVNSVRVSRFAEWMWVRLENSSHEGKWARKAFTRAPRVNPWLAKLGSYSMEIDSMYSTYNLGVTIIGINFSIVENFEKCSRTCIHEFFLHMRGLFIYIRRRHETKYDIFKFRVYRLGEKWVVKLGVSKFR